MNRSQFDDKDAAILARRVAARDTVTGPRVGDFLEFPDDRVHRFSHDWSDTIQHSAGGSFYIDTNGVSFSGSLEPAIPKASLVDTGQTRVGKFWFFHHDEARAHNGVDVTAPCRVYRLS